MLDVLLTTAYTLLALIAAFALGFAAVCLYLTALIIRARRSARPRRITTEEREYRNIKALFDTLPQPRQEIPTTIRRKHTWNR